jgi:hypothetical protein
MAKTKRHRCFVIMPFSKSSGIHTDDYWNKHYTDFLEPLIESSNAFKAVRSEALHGDILRQIITDLVTAPLVVADLTDANPNVYWELGVRQSFKHSTITIAEHGTKRPFDLSTKGTLPYYPNDHIKMEKFKKQFLEAIADCRDNPESPDSHVLETIGGRGTLYQILMRDESLRRLDALIAETDRNRRSWGLIIAACKENPEKRKNSRQGDVSYPTQILRRCCIDLLISTRYISTGPDFYKKAETYSNKLLAVNARLPHWPDRHDPIERWLKEEDSMISKAISEFGSQLKREKEAVSVVQ